MDAEEATAPVSYCAIRDTQAPDVAFVKLIITEVL
jgi:hypothetical protein